eukprot:9143356-Alexandrium_andersonii.AAC.1
MVQLVASPWVTPKPMRQLCEVAPLTLNAAQHAVTCVSGVVICKLRSNLVSCAVHDVTAEVAPYMT